MVKKDSVWSCTLAGALHELTLMENIGVEFSVAMLAVEPTECGMDCGFKIYHSLLL